MMESPPVRRPVFQSRSSSLSELPITLPFFFGRRGPSAPLLITDATTSSPSPFFRANSKYNPRDNGFATTRMSPSGSVQFSMRIVILLLLVYAFAFVGFTALSKGKTSNDSGGAALRVAYLRSTEVEDFLDRLDSKEEFIVSNAKKASTITSAEDFLDSRSRTKQWTHRGIV